MKALPFIINKNGELLCDEESAGADNCQPGEEKPNLERPADVRRFLYHIRNARQSPARTSPRDML